MWMATIEIHANSCLPELVYGNPYSARLVLVFMWTQPDTLAHFHSTWIFGVHARVDWLTWTQILWNIEIRHGLLQITVVLCTENFVTSVFCSQQHRSLTFDFQLSYCNFWILLRFLIFDVWCTRMIHRVCCSNFLGTFTLIGSPLAVSFGFACFQWTMVSCINVHLCFHHLLSVYLYISWGFSCSHLYSFPFTSRSIPNNYLFYFPHQLRRTCH